MINPLKKPDVEKDLGREEKGNKSISEDVWTQSPDFVVDMSQSGPGSNGLVVAPTWDGVAKSQTERSNCTD